MKLFHLKNSKLISGFCLSVVFCFAVGCAKDNDEDNNGEGEDDFKMEVLQPQEAEVFAYGDTVWVRGTAEADFTLHGYNVAIIHAHGDNAGDTAFYAENHTHHDQLQVEEFWINEVEHHSDMKVDVVVNKDHGGNSSRKTVHFHCHPEM